MMRSDHADTYACASKPYEHSIAHLRSIFREFSTKDLLTMVKKLFRCSTTLVRSNLSCVRSPNEESGHVSTMNHDKKIEKVKLVGEPVDIDIILQKMELLKLTNKNWSIENVIWIELTQIMNKYNEMMRKFLGDLCRVKNFHFMLQRFENVNNPEEIVEGLEIMFSRDLSSSKDRNGETSEG